MVRIAKKYDKRNKNNNASVVFEAVLNADNSLEMGAVTINTHKGNGKVNGTYRFDVSKKKEFMLISIQEKVLRLI
jgi:hypothetical protein